MRTNNFLVTLTFLTLLIGCSRNDEINNNTVDNLINIVHTNNSCQNASEQLQQLNQELDSVFVKLKLHIADVDIDEQRDQINLCFFYQSHCGVPLTYMFMELKETEPKLYEILIQHYPINDTDQFSEALSSYDLMELYSKLLSLKLMLVEYCEGQ